MTQEDKDFIEQSPKKIADTYSNDVDVHGMRTQEAQIKLQKMIYHYGQNVAAILLKEKK